MQILVHMSFPHSLICVFVSSDMKDCKLTPNKSK